jgi:hypothetical protein
LPRLPSHRFGLYLLFLGIIPIAVLRQPAPAAIFLDLLGPFILLCLQFSDAGIAQLYQFPAPGNYPEFI